MKKQLTMLAMATVLCVSCDKGKEVDSAFNYNDERFADIKSIESIITRDLSEEERTTLMNILMKMRKALK